MEIDELIDNFPIFYHMAEGGSWNSIREHGLLSTSAILNLYEYGSEARQQIESCHRPDSIEIHHDTYGNAVIRDQKPMSDSTLEKCLLDGLTPKDWYEILNSMTFFWTSQDRLDRLLNARPYKNRPHDVLIVRSKELIEKYVNSIYLSPMNSGCTRPFPHPRGISTFRKTEDYPFIERKRKAKGVWDAVVEVAVKGGVPDILEYVDRVECRQGSNIVEEIWSS
ncbi:MAG: hypothetical protein KZQ98_02655 [Candidatus Thiodiazotropha sp. (ex Lucinoma borealis)]|nr:hypothetical protein [Candidatus Thiodiazotropha sp. (ex Lucinoma borealis)]